MRFSSSSCSIVVSASLIWSAVRLVSLRKAARVCESQVRTGGGEREVYLGVVVSFEEVCYQDGGGVGGRHG